MKLTLVLIYQHHLCHHGHYYHLPHSRFCSSFSCWKKMCFSKKEHQIWSQKDLCSKPNHMSTVWLWANDFTPLSLSTLIHKKGFLSFTYNGASNGTISEKTLYNLHITTQVTFSGWFITVSMGLPFSQERRSKSALTSSLHPSHTHPRRHVHLQFLLWLVLVRDVPRIEEHFSALCFLWTHNSCVTPSRTRDGVPRLLFQHLFLTPYAVYLPDKVFQQGEYTFWVSPYLNGKFSCNFSDTLSVIKY